jgi:L-fuconolactonase
MRMDCAVALTDRSKFTYPRPSERNYTAADLWAILSRNRFEAAAVQAQLDDPAETDWLLGLTGSHPWIGAVMTRSTDLRQWDIWQSNSRFRGVISPPLDMLPVVERRGLVCSLGLSEAADALALISPARAVIRALEGVSFDPAEFEEWARQLETVRPSSALIQVGGLLTAGTQAGWRASHYAPWIRHLLQSFGADRLIYGSGWPAAMPIHTWKESLACFTQAMGAQTVADRGAILGENGSDFYGASLDVRYTE